MNNFIRDHEGQLRFASINESRFIFSNTRNCPVKFLSVAERLYPILHNNQINQSVHVLNFSNALPKLIFN